MRGKGMTEEGMTGERHEEIRFSFFEELFRGFFDGMRSRMG